MKIISILKNSGGFTLVQALFIVIVLALLGAVMMHLSGVQNKTTVFALQGARAYQAARSGVEWGVARAIDLSACPGVSSMTIEGFDVTTECSSQTFDDGGLITVYQIESTAVFGSYGSPDYISRVFNMKVAF